MQISKIVTPRPFPFPKHAKACIGIKKSKLELKATVCNSLQCLEFMFIIA